MGKSLKQSLKDFWQTERKLLSNPGEKHRDAANLRVIEKPARVTVAFTKVLGLETDQALLYADRIVVYHKCGLAVGNCNDDAGRRGDLFGRVEGKQGLEERHLFGC